MDSQNSARSGGPFVVADFYNTSELQGNPPGTNIAIFIQKAQGGTLMIPELGRLPLGDQKTLTEFLETKPSLIQIKMEQECSSAQGSLEPQAMI